MGRGPTATCCVMMGDKSIQMRDKGETAQLKGRKEVNGEKSLLADTGSKRRRQGRLALAGKEHTPEKGCSFPTQRFRGKSESHAERLG